jgi:hypothetical protein
MPMLRRKYTGNILEITIYIYIYWNVSKNINKSPQYLTIRLVFSSSYMRTHGLIRSRKPILTAVGIRCADHATPSIRKSWH